MLIVNIDLQNRLINGRLDTVNFVTKDRSGNISKTHVQFDDERADLKIIP